MNTCEVMVQFSPRFRQIYKEYVHTHTGANCMCLSVLISNFTYQDYKQSCIAINVVYLWIMIDNVAKLWQVSCPMLMDPQSSELFSSHQMTVKTATYLCV